LQAAGLILVVLVLVVVVDFSQRLAESQRQVESANRARTEVAQLERERTALQTQVAYATTDAAVIAWAHEHGKMIQPGEVLVVPMVSTAAATPAPAPIAPPPAPPNWELWRALFLGPRLP
jgi:predicted metalloprotease